MYFNNDPVKIYHKVQNVTQCDTICCFIHSEKVLCKVRYIFKFNVSWYINPCSPRYSLIYDSSGCPVIFTPFFCTWENLLNDFSNGRTLACTRYLLPYKLHLMTTGFLVQYYWLYIFLQPANEIKYIQYHGRNK